MSLCARRALRPFFVLSTSLALVTSWSVAFAQQPVPSSTPGAAPASPLPPGSAVLVPSTSASPVMGVPLRTLQGQGPGAVPAVPAVPAGTAAPLPSGQEPQPTTPNGATPPSAQPAAKPVDPAAAAAAAATAAANARLQKWKQLQFDRRPSAVLAAWSAPELQPYDPEKEKDKEKGGKAGEQATAPEAGAPPSDAMPVQNEGMVVVIDGNEVVMPPDAMPQAMPLGGQPAGAPASAAPGNAEQQLADKKLQRELDMVKRAVALSRWKDVAAFLQTIDEKKRKEAYEHFLRAVLNAPPEQNQRVPPNLAEKNAFSFDDALTLAGMAPGGFDKKQVAMLAPIVQRALESGSVLEELVRLLDVEVKKPAAEQRIDQREAAILLGTIAQEAEMGPFLPTAAEAEAKNDREALNLLARHALAVYAKDKRKVHLETAWNVTQAVLAKGEVEDAVKVEALRRAVDLAPKVEDQLGPKWLADSFTNRPERGMEIIATIGRQVSKGFQEKAQDAGYRAQGLQLQKTAVEALLQAAPALAEQWKPILALLASSWITEATYSYANSQSDSFGPMLQYDEFGNAFFSQMRRGGGGQILAVEPVDLLKAQPDPQWASLLDDSLRPHFATVSAQLFLKVKQPEKAFPFIEQLAQVNPRKAKELANEFLRVWTANNNPNANQRTSRYSFMFGFDERASGIPLTRSKQDRNLQELGSWVERLRQLTKGGVDEKLLCDAFVAVHSKAEVYRFDTIERVFGGVSNIDPVLLGTLLGTMRTNLATVWRTPSVQQENKTKRSQREMLEEVARGYQTALQVAQEALTKRGPHWALMAVVASILHDQNNFARELGRSSDFAEVRKKAFELFAAAAQHYASVAGELRLDQESIAAFDNWFYAALGASDLGAIDEETVVAKSQMPLIRAAIDALPKGSNERHLGMFANALFTRMTAVKPQIKYRYLEAGFAIVGDHPQAAEAKKVWDYYSDLVSELRLEAVVDGSTTVGTKPFGVRIDIVHSPEIERESGGFLKYAQNQNNGGAYYYNYGRPLENYRDRFTDAVTAALQENFEIVSITFNGETMRSRPTDQARWRATPYAWLLLKSRGPQIDTIPRVQIDFDFMDTTGYAVLPIGSTPVVIDASKPAEPRPWSELQLTQLLDERRSDEGKVTLEIKASSRGLVPDLDTLLTIDAPGFTVKSIDDQGASVTRFSEDQSGVNSERVWLVSFAPESAGAAPKTFVFGKPKVADMQVVYQRYDDANLETVTAEVALAGHRGSLTMWWIAIAAGAALLLGLLWFAFGRSRGRADAAAKVGLEMPKRVTPFTVLDLLARARERAGSDEAALRDLEQTIARIEACHFGRGDDPSLDLDAIATEWIRRVG